MKEITRIHLAKVSYEIELDAKAELSKYFTQLKNYTKDESIFSDIEIRVTEILAERGIKKGDIIAVSDVEQIKTQLGDPKVFADDSAELESDETVAEAKSAPKKLYRDTQNGMLGGVLAGVSLYFAADLSILRIVVAIFMLFPPTAVFLWPLYILMCIVVPPAQTANDILRLKGEKVAASNLKQVNEEYDFAAISNKKRLIKRILTAAAGVVFVLMATGAAIFTAMVSVGVIDGPNFDLYRNQLTIPFMMMQAAGVMFVVFCGILAYTFFVQKIKTWQIVGLIFLTVAGISSFAAGIITAAPQMANLDRFYRPVVNQLEISPEELKKVKKLTVRGVVNVRYIVSDQTRIETHSVRPQYEFVPKYKIEGENFMIDDGGAQGLHDGNFSEFVIYGPEIATIDASQASVRYINELNQPNKKITQQSLSVIQSRKSHVFIEGRSLIENLEIDISDADFYASDTSVDNLKLSTHDEGIVRLKRINKAEVKTDERCGEYRDQSFLKLAVLGGDIELNNQRYHSPTSCFKIIKEVNYDRG